MDLSHHASVTWSSFGLPGRMRDFKDDRNNQMRRFDHVRGRDFGTAPGKCADYSPRFSRRLSSRRRSSNPNRRTSEPQSRRLSICRVRSAFNGRPDSMSCLIPSISGRAAWGDAVRPFDSISAGLARTDLAAKELIGCLRTGCRGEVRPSFLGLDRARSHPWYYGRRTVVVFRLTVDRLTFRKRDLMPGT